MSVFEGLNINMKMEIIETGFNGLYVIQPEIFTDSRGYFFESFKQDNFRKPE